MAKWLELYKCNDCGNIVQVLVTGTGSLMCCGKEMECLHIKNDISEENLLEKHSPKIKFEHNITQISVSEHPMQSEHYIMFLQGYNDNEIYTKFLKANDVAEMQVPDAKCEKAVAYCNIHGLYRNKKGNT